jgi:hypothetical protein
MKLFEMNPVHVIGSFLAVYMKKCGVTETRVSLSDVEVIAEDPNRCVLLTIEGDQLVAKIVTKAQAIATVEDARQENIRLNAQRAKVIMPGGNA